ncbi:hypothetical protein HanRHA438_Chr02g0068441 [Helianthus annuus]|nr:hypothetical protein HanRHA438_Chr02g0068441 [Helianthus annuus]
MRMRYCLLSVFGLEGICEIDWHYDTLAYYQLSLFHCILLYYLLFIIYLFLSF